MHASDSDPRSGTAETPPEAPPSLSLDQQFARLFELNELPSVSGLASRHLQEAAAPVAKSRRAKVQIAAISILAAVLGIVAALIFLALIIAFIALRPR